MEQEITDLLTFISNSRLDVINNNALINLNTIINLMNNLAGNGHTRWNKIEQININRYDTYIYVLRKYKNNILNMIRFISQNKFYDALQEIHYAKEYLELLIVYNNSYN